jgi:hypothetical protein
LQEILDLLVGCAFGSGEKRTTYPRRGFVELVVRENAFNPLFPQPAQSTYAKDETIFVAFNQLLTLKASPCCAHHLPLAVRARMVAQSCQDRTWSALCALLSKSLKPQ